MVCRLNWQRRLIGGEAWGGEGMAGRRPGTILRHVCRLVGGDLTVESVYGQGSTFTVRLPVGSEGVR